MYANLVIVRIEEEKTALKALRAEVIPRVSKQPGFLVGYWAEPIDGEGISTTFWDSEAAARAAAQTVPVGSSPNPGVTITRVVTARVIGHAPTGGRPLAQASHRLAEAIERVAATARQEGEQVIAKGETAVKRSVKRGQKAVKHSVKRVERATGREAKKVSGRVSKTVKKAEKSAAKATRRVEKSASKVTKGRKKAPASKR